MKRITPNRPIERTKQSRHYADEIIVEKQYD